MGFALARALIKINPEHKEALYYFGLVGYDYRKK
jgi:ribosomal protein S9